MQQNAACEQVKTDDGSIIIHCQNVYVHSTSTVLYCTDMHWCTLCSRAMAHMGTLVARVGNLRLCGRIAHISLSFRGVFGGPSPSVL